MTPGKTFTKHSAPEAYLEEIRSVAMLARRKQASHSQSLEVGIVFAGTRLSTPQAEQAETFCIHTLTCLQNAGSLAESVLSAPTPAATSQLYPSFLVLSMFQWPVSSVAVAVPGRPHPS